MPNFANYNIYVHQNTLLNYLEEHFGLRKSLFSEYELYQKDGTQRVFLFHGVLNHQQPFVSAGLPIYKGAFPRGYVTNAFIYRFGQFATKNCISVTCEHFEKLLSGDGVTLPETMNNRGYQLILLGNKALGRGWIRQGNLFMAVPKIWRQNLT